MDNVTRLLMQGAAGAGGDPTYVDDVFSTYLYKGNQTAGHTITNGIDLAGEGGMVWIKSRTSQSVNEVVDSARGVGHLLVTNYNSAQGGPTSAEVDQFNSDGFRLAYRSAGGNANNVDYTSWSFRKQKGFFDVVTYTGNSSDTQTISHSLGCVPGLIIVKRTNDTGDWAVLHRSLGAGKYLRLNQTSAESDTDQIWNDTEPTSTQFTAGVWVNAENSEYVAYLFAGGASTAATARSVDFNGSSYLDIADHSDFTFGTDDFTIECWYKADDLTLSNNWDYIFSSGWPVQLAHTASGSATSRFTFYMADSNSTSSYIVSDLHTGNGSVDAGEWYHVAVTRSGSTFRIFLNGELKNTATSSGSAPAPNANSAIGRFTPASPYYYADGKISNFRYVKGTAVYTESFRPPTEPLTAITNTKLLCCNSSSVTGSTVTPGTITNNSATASTDSPFDDPAGFKFGEGGDQNIIKCGSYVGNGSTDGPEINLGWEPQWIIIKRSNATESWMMFDAMRGMTTQAGNDHDLRADLSNSEGNVRDYIDITSTGFKQVNTQLMMNGSGDTYVYMAIRRPDGLVGKPAEAGTDVFAMDVGSSSSNIPTIDTGFPVDFGLTRPLGSPNNWVAGSRLTGIKAVFPNDTANQTDYSNQVWDSNVGFWKAIQSTWTAWGWKRHAGLDVITYKSDGVAGRQLRHSLGRAPEMLWIKDREHTRAWAVYHKGLNSGTNPEDYWLYLDTTDAEMSNTNIWHSTAPTATHISLGASHPVNTNLIHDMICFAFASVDGISKCGYYTGDGSASMNIECGFQPRFLIIRRTHTSSAWVVIDTLRGWTTNPTSNYLARLDDTQAQQQTDFGSPYSTGFTINQWTSTSDKVIYYAHA